MKKLKGGMNSVVVCLFEVVIGILLLIDPIGFTTGIIKAAGVVLLMAGAISLVKYFKNGAEEAAMGQYLMKGVLAVLAGGFCLLKSGWFIVTFPAMTILYGVVVLVAGVGKIQLAFDLKRRGHKKWTIGLISAVLSMICAVVILNNPFGTTAVLWMFTGITLIGEAVVDLITMAVSGE